MRACRMLAVWEGETVLPKDRLLEAIETLLKHEINADCRRYLRGLYLELTNGKGSV